jgi:hypothetical protein
VSRGQRRGLVALTAGLLAGCASGAPALPSNRLTPTACEKRAFMTGQAPDVYGVEAVVQGLFVLAPESCPEAGGRLDGGSRAR